MAIHGANEETCPRESRGSWKQNESAEMRECTAKIHECRPVAALIGECTVDWIDGGDRCRRKAECTLAVRSGLGDHLAGVLESRVGSKASILSRTPPPTFKTSFCVVALWRSGFIYWCLTPDGVRATVLTTVPAASTCKWRNG